MIRFWDYLVLKPFIRTRFSLQLRINIINLMSRYEKMQEQTRKKDSNILLPPDVMEKHELLESVKSWMDEERFTKDMVTYIQR